MSVESVLSDAAIWASILLVAVAIGTAATVALVWGLTAPVTGPRLTSAQARATTKRVILVAAVIYVAAFLGGMIVGLFQ